MKRTLLRVVPLAGMHARAGMMADMRAQVQAPPDGQSKFWTVAGYRHGPSAFKRNFLVETTPLKEGVLDFKHYKKYTETVEFMKAWAKQYPDLVDLYVVAQSFGGIDIWQMTVTNKKTGKDTDKPAMYVEGNRHSGEVTAGESALWMLNYLLSNYGKDKEVTRLVDNFAFYFRPVNNPDGNLLYLETAQTLRSTIRPYDSDRDGLLDEDPAEDLDGDGAIRQMRVKVEMGKGDAVIDPRDPERPADAARRRRQGRLPAADRRVRQRRRRPRQRGRHRRPRPAPQLPGELAAGDRRDRARLHPGRRGRVPAVGDRNARGGDLPARAPERVGGQHHGHDGPDAAAAAVDLAERGAHVPGGPGPLQEVRHEGEGHHRLRARGRRLRGLRAQLAAVRPQPGLRLLAVRRDLVRRRTVERRQRRRLQQGRRGQRRARPAAVQRQGTEGHPLPAVEEDHPSRPRRGRGRRVGRQVLEPEPAAGTARNLDREGGAFQPDAGGEPAEGRDERAEGHRPGRGVHRSR